MVVIRLQGALDARMMCGRSRNYVIATGLSAGIRYRRQPVTNQVTTPPGNARRSATHSDTSYPLTCSNPTQSDAIGRNQHAW